MRKIIAQGAEAIVYRDRDKIIKHRIRKRYRIKEIDDPLRKQRTRREAKVIDSLPVPGPRLINVDDKKMLIEMEYLDGPRLSDVLEKKDYMAISFEIGKIIKKLHDRGIIHGDLTTSNMILLDEVFFIDFGLSFHSDKIEDKAVDLHLLSRAFESRHHKVGRDCFLQVIKGYSDGVVIRHLEKVEARGRNKGKL